MKLPSTISDIMFQVSKMPDVSQIDVVYKNREWLFTVITSNNFVKDLILPKGTLRFGNEILFRNEKIKFILKKDTPEKFAVERSRPKSSNVRFFRYYTITKKLQVGFYPNTVYEYEDVSPEDWINVRDGNARPRTTGSNRWGSWDPTKYPSMGAAVHEYLIRRGKNFRRL